MWTVFSALTGEFTKISLLCLTESPPKSLKNVRVLCNLFCFIVSQVWICHQLSPRSCSLWLNFRSGSFCFHFLILLQLKIVQAPSGCWSASALCFFCWEGFSVSKGWCLVRPFLSLGTLDQNMLGNWHRGFLVSLQNLLFLNMRGLLIFPPELLGLVVVLFH